MLRVFYGLLSCKVPLFLQTSHPKSRKILPMASNPHLLRLMRRYLKSPSTSSNAVGPVPYYTACLDQDLLNHLTGIVCLSIPSHSDDAIREL